MKSLKLLDTNTYLKEQSIAKKMRIRSIASSTAIETGASIASIESKLRENKFSRYQVKLA